MTARNTYRAWAVLALLSLAAAALGALPLNGLVLGALALGLSFLKARVILLDYLELRSAPRWRGGFVFVIGAFTAFLMALYALPVLVN